MKNFWTKSLALVLGVSLLSACGEDTEENSGNSQEPTTINGLVNRDARFSILHEALQRTGLESTLEAEGALTLFAPTNAAFNDLFSELQATDLNALENDLGSEGLKNVLLYHVLNQELAAADISRGYTETSAQNNNGNFIMAYLSTAGGVSLNNRATVEQADIEATNGVVHAINKVLLPASLYDLVNANPELSSLEAAMQAGSGVVTQFSESTFTLFAPDNNAFDDLVDAYPNVNTLNELFAELGPTDLTNTLLYHALNTETLAEDLNTGPNATAEGSNVIIDADGTPVRLFDNSGVTSGAAIVTTTNIVGRNGVIHILDGVLLP